MDRIECTAGDRTYPILIGRGVMAEVVDELEGASRAIIVTHPALADAYGSRLLEPIVRAGFAHTTTLVPPGERSKSSSRLIALLNQWADAGVTRDSVVIVLGGGVAGDLGGLAAALYMRGLRLVQVPTTLLAQVDSSIGGKVGIDLPHGKNLAGTFYQPRAVYVDPEALATLPIAEWRAGLGEVFKYAILRGDPFWSIFQQTLPALLTRDVSAAETIITPCIRYKVASVTADPLDTRGRRALLNLGHTFGHALEATTSYSLRHGEAVLAGLVAATALANETVGFPAPHMAHVARIARQIWFRKKPLVLDHDAIFAALKLDKKVAGGRRTWILPRDLGEVVSTQDVPDYAVERAYEWMIAWLNETRRSTADSEDSADD